MHAYAILFFLIIVDDSLVLQSAITTATPAAVFLPIRLQLIQLMAQYDSGILIILQHQQLILTRHPRLHL